jgi:hypothetical protein
VNRANKNHAPDISYFRLSLMQFLKESHPELINDNHFIIDRTDAATETYEQVIRSGGTPFEAIEQANSVLYKDLHFSRRDTIVNILWNEFADETPAEEADTLAAQLLPECEHVFAEYPLTDDFAYNPAYELLYTELTGTIALLLETRNL